MRKTLILLALLPSIAFAQQGSLALPDLGSGVRKTNPAFGETFNPEWHDPLDVESDPPAGFSFPEDIAITAIDLTTYCSAPEDYAGAGVRVVTVASGTLPTGISLSASVLTGTPTTVSSGTVTFTCTLDGSGTDDEDFTFDITASDTTAPAVPSNLFANPTGGTSQTELTISWSAVTDPSGILHYVVRYASTEALCNSASNSDNTLLENSTDTTATLGSLTASTTRWFKVRARDNSAAQNQSDFSSCVSGTTASGGGGGGGADIFSDEFATGSVPNTAFWNESSEVTGSGDCDQTIANGYLTVTLTANPTANDAGGGTRRCELAIKDFLAGIPGGLIQEGDTVYYGFAVRMPAATAYDSVKDDTINQTFQDIGNTTGCHESMVVSNNLLKWKTQDCVRPNDQETIMTPLPKDTWVNICWVYKWEKNGTGFHKVWVNPSSESSTPVLNYSGQTLIAAPQYVGKEKFGIYKPQWKTGATVPNQEAVSPRVYHFAYVRIATTFDGACGDPL